MEPQALPDQASILPGPCGPKEAILPAQCALPTCLRRQRMREIPQEFAFSFSVCSRHNLHAISSTIQRAVEPFCLRVFHCASIATCLSPNVSIAPDRRPTPVDLESPFLHPSLPRPWQPLVGIPCKDLPIPSVSNTPLWHLGACLAVSMGSTHVA